MCRCKHDFWSLPWSWESLDLWKDEVDVPSIVTAVPFILPELGEDGMKILLETIILDIKYQQKRLRMDQCREKKIFRLMCEIWFKKINSVENKQRSGRPRTFSEREERWIVRQVYINTRTSAVKLTLKCKSGFRKSLNPETVRNVLRKHKYHGRVPRRKPYISKANRKVSLAFAKMYVKQPTEFWENVIFVDESKYNIFGSDDKQKV
ncbi:hypothetical protein AVEN_205410-1 [Araneus ventricosus]|uniref:Transposase Tc1-like domain-containing protein n=1 Tax=Araneus ventricosus TaxID=182803 RepID=A0A4Y2LZQ2_ARAVE|nr:hypothetical protein AVEN_205410-1 [Araneus ventricosus]